MNTIQSKWELFERLVIPKDAPEIQRKEMRRAFYAGAEAILQLQFVIGEESISEDAAMAMLTGLHSECAQFGQQIASGHA
jgi:hypothetical protein